MQRRCVPTSTAQHGCTHAHCAASVEPSARCTAPGLWHYPSEWRHLAGKPCWHWRGSGSPHWVYRGCPCRLWVDCDEVSTFCRRACCHRSIAHTRLRDLLRYGRSLLRVWLLWRSLQLPQSRPCAAHHSRHVSVRDLSAQHGRRANYDLRP
jgi:hypothetical protein